MSDQIQVPMPRAGMASDFKGGKSYNIEEYIAQIEPRYRIYNEQISRCISGLTAYAAQQAASGQDVQIPMLRDLVMDLACFWNLDGGLDKASEKRMERQYGGSFDQAVSEARQSGQCPEFTDQAKRDVLTGLEVYMQEMTLDGDMGEWIQNTDELVQRLRSEWQMEPVEGEQNVLTFTMGGMA